MIFKCSCITCVKYSNENCVYWSRENIKNIKNHTKNIKWRRTSWYAWRGFENNNMIAMYYIWNTYYWRTCKTNNAQELSIIFKLLSN